MFLMMKIDYCLLLLLVILSNSYENELDLLNQVILEGKGVCKGYENTLV